MGWFMISPICIGGCYDRQVNGVSCRIELKISSFSDRFKGAAPNFIKFFSSGCPKTMRQAPKRNRFLGRGPLPMKSANALEVSKEKFETIT